MYEALSFLYAFNYHNYGFLVAIVMLFYMLNQNDYTLTFSDDVIFRYLLVGSMAFMGLTMKYNGFPLLSTFVNRYLAPTILFLYGYAMAMEKYARFQRNLVIIAFGTFLHGILNIITNIGVDVLSRVGRTYMDIGGELIAATLQNLLFVMPAGLLFYFVVCYNEYKPVKVMGCIMGVTGVFGSILNASRTVILLTGLLFFFALAVYLYCENEYMDTAVLKLIGTITILITVAVVIFGLNLFDIQGRLANSALGQRTEKIDNDVSSNSRWKYAGEILQLLPFHLMGNIPYPHYAHNLFVDAAKEAGVIPFVSYILLVWATAKKVFWLIKSSLFSSEEKVVLAPVTMGLIFVFFTEPILEGAPQYLALFTYIAGGLTCMTDCARETDLLDI